MIDKNTVQRIKDTADIVDVVGDYVHLVRRGSNYMGLCPFHNERTPSFSVNKRRNFCYCFSCHKGGSPVNFIMEKEGLSYHDALLHLAKRYGIKVEERELTDEERLAQTERESLLVANEWAMQQMERTLWETEEGRNIGVQYFFGRGVTEEAAKAFHLGYSLDNGQAMANAVRQAGFDSEVMLKLGILGRSSRDGALYDRFRGRVIFPVFSSAGKVVAFGGRDLKGAPAKYINSPESSLYKKSNELYGIYQAKGAIVRQDKCFLVEGYMDVIGMWQSGMENVVASSGTALTDGQIALIHRFTENITLIYDGDAAGIKASLRGIDMLLSHKMKVQVLLLPDGHDPDSFARRHTPEEFRDYVAANETDIIRFKVKVLMDDAGNDTARRIDAVRSVVQSLACIPDKIARNIYVQECSELLGVKEEVIGTEVSRARAELIARMRRDRELRRLDPGDNPAPSGNNAGGASLGDQSANNPKLQPGSDVTVHRQITSAPVSALDQLERRIVEVALRFGLLDYCEAEISEDDGHDSATIPEMINVVEVLADELEADSISLSNPAYASVFGLILDMRDDLERARPVFEARIDEILNNERKEGRREIAAKEASLDDIQIQERILEDRLALKRQEAWQEFVKEYPGRILASHENADVRNVVTDLLREPYQLSRVFFRDRTPERDEDRLQIIVPRVLHELKEEILNLKLKDLMERFRLEAPTATHERQVEMQRSIAVLMHVRSQLAKGIGERIVASRTLK